MQATQKRILVYGLAAAVVGGLGWVGFVRHTPADLATLLGAIDNQLRLAYLLPEKDRDGRPFSERAAMLDTVERMLDDAAAQDPRLACIEEYRGFLHRLRHEPRAAALCYRRARAMDECPAEMADTLVFNEARMLLAAGDHDGALQAFADHGDRLQPQWRAERDVERAGILAAAGRLDAAATAVEAVIAGAGAEPMAAIRAGELMAEHGRTEVAERAYRAAATVSPVGTYRWATLKRDQGSADTAIELLERAAQAAPGQVASMIRADRDAWLQVVDGARIERLLESGEPAGPSR